MYKRKERFAMNHVPKTVLCIHSLPCFGRSALTVILPVLSALGAQVVPLPTTMLSTHTGRLGAPAKLDSAAFGAAALNHYRQLGVQFDAVYIGYLAEPSQAQLAMQALELWPEALKVVDPILGDNGSLYRGLSPELVTAMADLCTRADLILPNLTEASLLLGLPMPSGNTVPAEQAANAVQRLCKLCPQVLVTGVLEPDGRSISCVGAERGEDVYTVRTALQPRMFHGTGDIFGAVMVGRLLQGNVPEAAAQAAAAFVGACIRQTPPGSDERLGVHLEAMLPDLIRSSEAIR